MLPECYSPAHAAGVRAFASFLFFIVSGRSAITNKILQLSSSGAALDAGKQQRQALLGLV